MTPENRRRLTIHVKLTPATVLKLVVVPIVGLAVALVYYKLPLAFAAIFAILAIYLLSVAFAVVRNSAVQNALVSVATVSLCFAIAEVGAWFLNMAGVQTTDTLEYSMDDPDLGYRPVPGQVARAREFDGNQSIFDVTYTIDSAGYRWTPGPATAPCRAVFFGDSLTFGWGLPDDLTLPARFAAASRGRYRVYNLSFNGYGPHQMLRSLETGRLNRVLGNQPADLVIYQGIKAHLTRVAGRVSWDLRGPRYVIIGNGDDVRYEGPFHSDAYVFFRQLLNQSQIVTYLNHRSADDEDLVRLEEIPLYVAVVRMAQRKVERRSGPGSFVVLFADDLDKIGIEARKRLSDAGVYVIPFEQMIPDIYSNDTAYELSPLDPHPNATFNNLAARFLAKEIGPQRCRHPTNSAGTTNVASPTSAAHNTAH